MKRTVSILNKLHYEIEVEGHVFPPGEEVFIQIESTSQAFRNIRAVKGLRVGKHNNEEWKRKHRLTKVYSFNMVYDIPSQHRGNAYVHAIEALANPIVNHLPEGSTGFVYKPTPGINLRFFSEMRIRQQGKFPVGPRDVFMSHGIGDKDYWIAKRIAGYKHALVPGPAWKERIEAGGYKGKVWVVGYTKLDPLFNGDYKRSRTIEDKPYVVWAPTHGYHSKRRGRSSYPQCMEHIEEIAAIGEYDTHVALHPTSRMGLNQRQNVTMQELLDADVVIADAGSTLYEAWALGKPVIFPDWLCKDDVLKHFGPDNLEHQIYAKGIGYHARDMKEMIKMVEKALQDGMQDAEIEFMEQVFPSELRGRAGQKSAEALMSIKEGVVW